MPPVAVVMPTVALLPLSIVMQPIAVVMLHAASLCLPLPSSCCPSPSSCHLSPLLCRLSPCCPLTSPCHLSPTSCRLSPSSCHPLPSSCCPSLSLCCPCHHRSTCHPAAPCHCCAARLCAAPCRCRDTHRSAAPCQCNPHQWLNMPSAALSPLSFMAANWLSHLPTTLSPPIDATTASPLAECSLSRRAAASCSRFHGLTLPSPTCWLIVGSCFAFLCCFSKEMHTLFLHLNCRCRRRKLGGGTCLQCGAEAAEAAIP